MPPAPSFPVSNVETGESFSATSNDSGNYVIPLIKPGKYLLTAEKPGFKQYQETDLVLETGGQSRVDVQLQVGALSERVVVEARAPLLQSENLVDRRRGREPHHREQTLSFDPPVESLQEFNVSISNYAAELGRTGGGVVQMTTKTPPVARRWDRPRRQRRQD